MERYGKVIFAFRCRSHRLCGAIVPAVVRMGQIMTYKRETS